MLAQLRQRIARLLRRDHFWGFVGLRILKRMPLEPRHSEPEQRRPMALAHMFDRVLDQRAGFNRIGAITRDHGKLLESFQVRRDVAARRLQRSRHRDAIPIVLDVEKHRQLEHRRHVERRPKPVRRHRPVATKRNRNRTVAIAILQHRAAILQRLCPSSRRCVLRTDSTTHRQRRRALRIRIVEDRADIAPVRVAAGPRHRRAKHIGHRHAERKQNGPRPVVAANRIVLVR